MNADPAALPRDGAVDAEEGARRPVGADGRKHPAGEALAVLRVVGMQQLTP